MEKNSLIIALDGPSGTGKSSTAKAVAKNLGLLYLNTGAMYRGITYLALQNNIKATDITSLKFLAESTDFDFDSKGELILNGTLVHDELVSPEVSEWVSYYCKPTEVRSALTNKQRELGNSRPSILDGRDIGTVVFPNASFKFYLVADYRVRAQRRYAELQSKGIEQTIESIEQNLIERDRLDTERKEAPLVQADDAILIDTTQMSFNQQVERICSVVGVVATESNASAKTPEK